MAKQVVWDNPNKMHFESGHKTFDRQVISVARGSVVGGGQLSGLVRAYNTPTNPLGRPCKAGEMQAFDLHYLQVPHNVAVLVRHHARAGDVWVYEFYHYVGQRRVSHGFVICDYAHTKALSVIVTGPTYKSEQVLQEAIKYLVD